MSSVVLALGAVTLLYAVGHAVTRVLIRSDERAFSGMEHFFLAGFLGIAFVSLAQLYMLVFHIPLTRWTILAACAIPAGAGVFSFTRAVRALSLLQPAAACRQWLRSLSPLEKALCAALALLAVMNVYLCVSVPVSAWDAMATWAYKAKVLFYTKTIYVEDFLDPYSFNRPMSYPLFLPLAIHFMFSVMDVLNEQFMKLLFSVMFISSLFFFYWALSRHFGLKRAHALLGTLAFFSIPAYFIRANGSMRSEMADFPIAFYFAAGFVYLWEYLRVGRLPHFLLSVLISAAAVMMKLEGIVLYGLMLFFLAVEEMRGTYRKRFWRTIAHAAAVSLLCSGWYLIRPAFPFTGDHFGLQLFAGPGGIEAASRYFVEYSGRTAAKIFLDLGDFGFMWYALLIALFIRVPRFSAFARRRDTTILCITSIYFILLVCNEVIPFDGRTMAHDFAFGFARFRFHILPLLWMLTCARLSSGAKGIYGLQVKQDQKVQG